MPFLGEIPIDPRVAECGDQGVPIVARHPDSAVARSYQELAATVRRALGDVTGGPELPEVQL